MGWVVRKCHTASDALRAPPSLAPNTTCLPQLISHARHTVAYHDPPIHPACREWLTQMREQHVTHTSLTRSGHRVAPQPRRSLLAPMQLPPGAAVAVALVQQPEELFGPLAMTVTSRHLQARGCNRQRPLRHSTDAVSVTLSTVLSTAGSCQ